MTVLIPQLYYVFHFYTPLDSKTLMQFFSQGGYYPISPLLGRVVIEHLPLARHNRDSDDKNIRWNH